jgi:hypothetical protein
MPNPTLFDARFAQLEIINQIISINFEHPLLSTSGLSKNLKGCCLTRCCPFTFKLPLYLSFYTRNSMATSKKFHENPVWAFITIYFRDTYYRVRLWQKLYGLKSILLHLLACSQVWCIVHRLLKHGGQKHKLFEVFRDSQNSECSAVALAVRFLVV